MSLSIYIEYIHIPIIHYSISGRKMPKRYPNTSIFVEIAKGSFKDRVKEYRKKREIKCIDFIIKCRDISTWRALPGSQDTYKGRAEDIENIIDVHLAEDIENIIDVH